MPVGVGSMEHRVPLNTHSNLWIQGRVGGSGPNPTSTDPVQQGSGMDAGKEEKLTRRKRWKGRRGREVDAPSIRQAPDWYENFDDGEVTFDAS